MQKISGIIPSSPRLASVDLKEAPPVRPGAPTFGRASAVSSLKEMEKEIVGPNTATRSSNLLNQQMDWRTKDARQAAMAAELADKFFIKNRQSAEPFVQDVDAPSVVASRQVPVSSTPAGFKTDAAGSFRANALRPEANLNSNIFEETEDIAIAKSTAPVQSQKFRPEASELNEENESQQPEGLFPKGSFIDRTA